MRAIGKLFQFIALVLLPLAMLMQLNGRMDLRQMLMAMVFGCAAFYLGRILEGYAAP